MTQMPKRDTDKYISGWKSGLPETPCGFGSMLKNTTAQRAWITKVVQKYDIKTIADIGCGDCNWIKETDLKGAVYRGYDLVQRTQAVEKLDIVCEKAPKADLLMCFWVINHMNKQEQYKALENLFTSGSKYLMITGKTSWDGGEEGIYQYPYIERLDIDGDAYVNLIINA